MSSRKLEQWEKDFITDHIQDGITEGEDDEKLAERRKELLEIMDDVTQAQINAVSAWIKIRQQRALDIAHTAKEDNAMRPENTSIQVINGPEHFNYDNDRKERWRKKWEEFIDNETEPSERSDMKVLCFPGKMCLEVPLYLRLGFRPENITGVEGGDEQAKAVFRNNSTKFGIRAIGEKMESFLENDMTRYGVVSLDFHSQPSATAFKIARKLLLAPKALVLTNFMAKREREELQLTYAKFQGALQLNNDDFKQHGAHALRMGEERGADLFMNDEFSLQKARTLTALGYHSNFGCLRQENHVRHDQLDNFPIHPKTIEKYDGCGGIYSYEDLQFMFRRESIGMAMPFFLETITKALEQHGMPPVTAKNMTFMMNALSIRGYFGTPFTKKIKSYRYISKSAKGASPFESDFAVLNSPKREYEEMRHTLEFLLAGAASVMRSAINDTSGGELYLTNKHNRQLCFGQRVSNSDILHLRDAIHGSHAKIKIGKIFHDLQRYSTLYENGVCENLDKNNLVIPREIIE